MKYLSLDLETSSLEPSPDHILQISMVVEDSQNPIPLSDLPHFTCFVSHDTYQGEAYALSMNGWILDILSGRTPNNTGYEIISADGWPTWMDKANYFLNEHFPNQKITVAGKNVAGFDIPFLPKEISSRFRHRVIDPTSLFIDWEKDTYPPDFKVCNTRAGLSPEVAHDARQDALGVIALLRTQYKKV